MKTRLLIIIIVFIIGVTIYLGAFSYFTPSTKENPYGIEARVMIQSTYLSPPIQPKSPIEPQDVLWLRYNTKQSVDLREFIICNGPYCITHQSGNEPPHPELSGFSEKLGGGTIGDLPWKIGDTVHIWVKTRHIYSSENGDLIKFDDPGLNIDLGESKIIRGPTERI